MSWTYKTNKIGDVTQFPENTFGFVYLITHKPTNKSYIGKKVLYFSPATMMGVDKPFDLPYYMSMCESFAFSHKWKPNQVVLWDNLRYMHRRDSYKDTGYREMHRVQFRYVV